MYEPAKVTIYNKNDISTFDANIIDNTDDSILLYTDSSIRIGGVPIRSLYGKLKSSDNIENYDFYNVGNKKIKSIDEIKRIENIDQDQYLTIGAVERYTGIYKKLHQLKRILLNSLFVFLSLAVLTGIGFGIFFIADNIADNFHEKRLLSKHSISNEEVLDITQIIFKKYTKQECRCKLYNLSQLKERGLLYSGSIYQNVAENLGSEDVVLSVWGDSDFLSIGLMTPKQVVAAFNCFVTLKDKELKNDIAGIGVNFSFDGFEPEIAKKFMITREEFDWLYTNTDVSGMTDAQVAEILAQTWISMQYSMLY